MEDATRRTTTMPMPMPTGHEDGLHDGSRIGAFSPCAALFSVILACLVGCAGKDEPDRAFAYPEKISVAERLEGAPAWVTQGCRAHWTSETERTRVVCGVGSAESNRNRLAARDTAVARARSAIARSVTVTIENLVRLEDGGRSDGDDGELRSIVHQLTSASLPACQVESVWQSKTGAYHALVSLQVATVQHSVRETTALPPATREDLARRAGEAFAQLNAMDAATTAPSRDE